MSNPVCKWERRYRELEKTVEQMMLYSERKRELRFMDPEVSTIGDYLQVTIPTAGQPARMAFWVYVDGKLIEKKRYSHADTICLPYKATPRLRLRVFAAYENGKEAHLISNLTFREDGSWRWVS